MNLHLETRNIFQLLCLCSVAFLSSCISYEPALLVPAISLSAEEVSFVSSENRDGDRLDFGLDTTRNESDSLSNIQILPGMRVRSVDANGPAESAGIQVGDIILSVDGTETNQADVLEALQSQSPSQSETSEFTFRVRRNTTVFQATVIGRELNTNPPPQELYRIDPIATRAGFTTEILAIENQPKLPAARVVEIFPESPLPAANIEVGDLILSINGERVNSAQGLVSRLNQDFALGETVNLEIYDGRNVRQAPLKLWDPGRRISRVSLWPLMLYESSLNPSTSDFTILDFWLFAIYRYSRNEGEQSHSLIGLFNFTSDYGELIEESN